jgi:3-methyl-2-oxobutanoate hydroxymethyltransferase
MRSSKHYFFNLKEENKKIKMITAYDYSQAKIAESAEVDSLLVGDSLANVVLGYNKTTDIGMDEMLIFVKAVSRGSHKAHILADMPWKSDHNVEKSVLNAKAFITAGAHSVKVEGDKYAQIEAIISAGVAVVGHLGLTPQTARSLKKVGTEPEEADRIFIAAKHLESLGVSAIVVEHIPAELGERLATELKTPIIGIGAGKKVDGQVMVFHDALGLFEGDAPPIAKKFTNLFKEAVGGLKRYNEWTEKEEF